MTTRSRLRGVRFLPPMLVATMRVRRQLACVDGVVRWASVIAGPREFWTLTVWSSRHAMQEFMRSGAHGDVMWLFARWLRSFWLMRWRPGRCEVGSWDGATLAGRGETAADATLDRLSLLGGGDDVREPRLRVEHGCGAVVRLPLGPRALRELRALRRRLRQDDGLLRAVLGVGNGRDLFLFAVWADAKSAAELLESDWARSAAARYRERLWLHELHPESELGHWDGLRVRVAARARAARGPAAEPRAGAPPRSRAREHRP